MPPSTEAQFPLCTATERRWSRKSAELVVMNKKLQCPLHAVLEHHKISVIL
jgi:hypothetical protein